VDHHGRVIVVCRSASGQWVQWRVGRRRLAWRPGSSVFELLEFTANPYFAVLDVPILLWLFLLTIAILLWWLVMWTTALLATAVAWPVRHVSGKWPVVAYPTDSDSDDGSRLLWVQGRAAADATARRWAADLKQDGRIEVRTG
jgi:hypothetical protein